jgi:hypothetical protein
MIVLHSIEICALYPNLMVSSPFGDYRTSMLPCLLKHKHTFLSVRLGDHYILLPRSTLGGTSDFARVFTVP